MEGMIYAGLKKKGQKIFEKLCEENLKRSWFICYQITQDTCTAVPLLLAAWQESITQVMDTSTIPEETFHEILFSNIFTLSLGDLICDCSYQQLDPPQVAKKYERFVQEITFVSKERRLPYLIRLYGNISTNRMSEILGIQTDEVSQSIIEAETEIREKSSPLLMEQWAEKIRLSAEFRNPTGSGFREVIIPDLLQNAFCLTLRSAFEKAAKQKKPFYHFTFHGTKVRQNNIVHSLLDKLK